MKLIIDRQKWLRGEGGTASRLLRPSDGKMCCLGFYALNCGLLPKEIENLRNPSKCGKPLPAWLFDSSQIAGYSEDCSNLMKLNDARNLYDIQPLVLDKGEEVNESMREKIITEKFALHGVVVEFIN